MRIQKHLGVRTNPDADERLGHGAPSVSERDRIEMISNPDYLFEFVERNLRALFTLSYAINKALAYGMTD